MKRFLIVKIAALGDVVLGSTLLGRIRREHPGAHVTWLTGDGAKELVALFAPDELITVNEQRLLGGSLIERAIAVSGVWRKLAGKRFDAVLLLHADVRYRVLTLPIAATNTYALELDGPRANPLLTRFRGDEYARLLSGEANTGPIIGRYPLADVRDRLPAAEAERLTPRVALVPGGTRNVLREDVLRRWPVQSYRALAERLARQGCEVVLIGDTHDEWVRTEFAGLPVRDEIGRHTIVSTLALLRNCDVVVCHDTGPLHFARLVRTPIVALFGPTDPRHVVGGDPDITSLWGGEHLACRPCYDGRSYAQCSNNLCIQSVSVDDVVGAVDERLAARTMRSLSMADSANTRVASSQLLA